MNGTNAIYFDVFDQSTIDCCKCYGRTIRIIYLDVFHFEVTETTSRYRPEFQATGTRTSHTVLDNHVLTHAVRIMRFKAKRIIRRIDKRVFQHNAVTVYHIDTVIIPIGFAIHVDSVDIKILTLVVCLVPACRVPQGDILDCHILAFTEIDVLRTVRLVRTAQFQWIFVDTPLDIVHHIVGCLKTTPVNRPFPRYTNILLLDCENHRHPTNIRIFFVIPRIGRSQ